MAQCLQYIGKLTEQTNGKLMSMTEMGINPQKALEPLPNETLARLERIKILAKQNAARNVKRLKNFKPALPPKTATKPAKAQKPYFYNPANRD